MTGDAETTEPACPAPGSHRVVTDIDPGRGHWERCGVCFDDAEPQDSLDADGELCLSGAGKLHRTRREAGTLSPVQDDYAGYTQGCSKLERMSVEEFDELVGGGSGTGGSA